MGPPPPPLFVEPPEAVLVELPPVVVVLPPGVVAAAVTVTWAEADLVESAADTAVTVAVAGVGTDAGAV